MRVVIDMGHTPASPGASGYLDELSCDREAGKRIIAELERRGHTVYNSTPPDWVGGDQEINDRWMYANSLSNIDLFCSLHLNAAHGHGTEVLYYVGDSTGQKYASIISDNVARALDLPDRGAKSNDWVGVICNTNPTAVLIEFCFVDTYEDAQAWWACPWDDLVDAVCDGIELKAWERDEEEMALKEIEAKIDKLKAEIDEVNAKIDKIAELTKPVITSNPLSKTAKIGEKAQFGIVAVGVGISYQWQYLGRDGKTWYNVTAADYSGLKSKTMTVPVTSKRNGLTFRCKVSNASGTVYSTSAKLTAKA